MSVSNGWQSDVVPYDDRLLSIQRIIENDLVDAVDQVRYDTTKSFDVYLSVDEIWAQFHPASPPFISPDWNLVQLPDLEDVEDIREALEIEDVAEVYRLVSNVARAVGLIA